jgi:hypothetical protein
MGGIHSNSPALQKRAGGIRVHYAVPPTPPERRVREPWVPGALVAYLHRHGAAGARGAHNSEDTGSRPVAGILFAGARADLFSKKMKCFSHHLIEYRVCVCVLILFTKYEEQTWFHLFFI